MDQTVPRRESNDETIVLAPVVIVDCEAIAAAPGTKGRERPAGRERRAYDGLPAETKETNE
jgi:hypothetical protein